MLVATVCSPDIDACVDAVAAAREDMVEVRLDALWPSPPEPETAAAHLERLLASAQAPLLATLRPVRQGGSFDGPEAVRISLLQAAAQAGFQAVDIEIDLEHIAPVVRHLRTVTDRVVLSDHLPKAPEGGLGLRHLTAMQDRHGIFEKMAFPASTFPARLRALELAHTHRARSGRPAVQPIGADAALRALLGVAGNVATYVHAPGLPPAVEGQPSRPDVEAVWTHWGLRREDLGRFQRWFGVLGDPVLESLSPRMHNAALRALGRPERFAALQVPGHPGMLRLVVSVADRIGLAGASVTMPHKQTLVQVARPDGTAKRIGAANCLYFEDGQPHCTNTDHGALRSILHGNEGDVLVLGAGGLARAAIVAAQDEGLSVRFASRDPARAKAVQDALGAPWIAWDASFELRPDILVQATPADVPHAAAPLTVEARYPGPTALALRARGEGRALIGGDQLLVRQGALAFAKWTGEAPDESVMRGEGYAPGAAG